MKRTLRDLEKYAPQTQRKFSVLGFLIIGLFGIPIMYWIIWLFWKPWERIVKFIIDLF